jgi:cytochrome c-type biogenesis protein CcmE
MDPARKRRIRLVVALSAAVLLATALVYTSFSASAETTTPSELVKATPAPGQQYELTGKVADNSWHHEGTVHTFRVRDRTGTASVPVTYKGPVPDPFREGREIVITVEKHGDGFVGQPNTLVTKCPSKFTTEAPQT